MTNEATKSEKMIEGITCDCDTNCRKKAKKRLFITMLILIGLFTAGYFLRSEDLRIIWLIISGAGAVLCALFIYLVHQGIVSCKKGKMLPLLLLGFALLSSCLKEEPLNRPYNGYAPADLQDGWVLSTPQAEGMDETTINNLYRQAFREDYFPTLKAMLLVRHGKLVAESYLKDNKDISNLHNIMSATKGITSILAGIAIDKKVIESLETPVYQYLSEYFDSVPQKRGITVRQVLSMETGLDFNNEIHASQLIDYPGSSLEFILHQKMVFDPGTSWYYGNGNPQLISGIIQEKTGMKLSEFAEEYLFGPLGITDYRWESLKDGLTYGAQGLWLSARDMAKIGVLMVSNGAWKGNRIVSADWVFRATQKQSDHQNYGYYWYPVNGVAYYAEGHGGQLIFAYPEKELVAIMVSEPYAKSYNLSRKYEELFSLIMRSIDSKLQ